MSLCYYNTIVFFEGGTHMLRDKLMNLLEQKEADFKTEKDTLTTQHKEEVLTLQQEKKALDKTISEMQEELSAFRAEAEAKLAKELEAKKERLVELAQKFDAEDLLREDMDEAYLDENIAMLERVDAKVNPQKETVPKFKAEQQAPHEGNEEGKEHVPFSRAAKYFSFGEKR